MQNIYIVSSTFFCGSHQFGGNYKMKLIMVLTCRFFRQHNNSYDTIIRIRLFSFLSLLFSSRDSFFFLIITKKVSLYTDSKKQVFKKYIGS